MKSHNLSKSGIVALAIGGAALLSTPDVLAEKIRAAGTVASETVCVVQGLTGGMVNIVGSCDTASSGDSGPAASTTGD